MKVDFKQVEPEPSCCQAKEHGTQMADREEPLTHHHTFMGGVKIVNTQPIGNEITENNFTPASSCPNIWIYPCSKVEMLLHVDNLKSELIEVCKSEPTSPWI